ncbi:MAG: hypothetical protein IJ496_07700 [Ruminococcus sp.]|nr:hypothetical protein [Ruminococcus sp.]
MKKKKTTSVLGVIVAVILIIVAATTMLTTALFATQDTPQLFGYYLYLQKSDAMEVTDGEDDSASIHANTVVFAKAYNGTDPLSVNNAILCVLAPDDSSPIEDKDSNGYAIRRILRIEPNEETGELLYYPTTMRTDSIGTEPAITASSILGLCQFEHAGLYTYITFVQTMPGILLLLALPCVLLIAMLITKIVRARNRKLDEDAYAFEESYDGIPGEDMYDEEYEEDVTDDPSGYDDYADEPSTPLYTPDMGNTSTLDRKRVSIAQNFTPKAVNPNSPYQKARTMQFKAQKDVPILRGSAYDQPQVSDQTPVQPQTQAPVQPQVQAPAAEDSGYVGKYAAAPQNGTQEYHGAHEAGSTSGGRVFRSSGSITSTFRKPNVDDILSGDPLSRVKSEPASAPTPAPEKKPSKPSYTSSSKRSGSRNDNASVDDLLNMIENQKKKL